MRPNSRASFIKYCREQIGEPLFRINIADSQLDNRVDEALDQFNEYHREATEHCYIAVPVTQELIDKGYIETPEGVHYVIRMVNYNANVRRHSTSGSTTFYVNGTYMTGFYGNGLGPASGYGDDGVTNLYVYLMDQKLAEHDMMYARESTVSWNRHTRRLNIEADLKRLQIGTYILYEAYVTLESMGNASMWNNDWLKRYATALISKQWGQNLTKFAGGSLFGGDIQHNGPQILADANQEIEKLREELFNTWTIVPPMIIG